MTEYFLGIDIGASTAKAVLIDGDENVLASSVIPSGVDFAQSAKTVRENVLAETYIRPGYKVLDYGCGPGTFTVKIAEIVGPAGFVYGLDIHPLAIKYLEDKTSRKNLKNIQPILSGCATSLEDGCVDLVVFFDVYHLLSNKEDVLRELRRVLKPGGILCFSDHHLSTDHCVQELTETGLFILDNMGDKTISFIRA